MFGEGYDFTSHLRALTKHLGIATLNVTGLSGALIQMLAHGLVAGALFTGPVAQRIDKVSDLQRDELFAASVLTLGVIWLGVFPSAALELSAAAISHLSAAFGDVSPPFLR